MKSPVLSLVAALACSCQSRPKPDHEVPSLPPLDDRALPPARDARELLAVVHDLALGDPKILTPVPDLGIPALATQVLTPQAGLALWYTLARARPSIQFQPVVISNEAWRDLHGTEPAERVSAVLRDLDQAKTLTPTALFAEREAALDADWQDLLENAHVRHEQLANGLAEQRRSRDSMVARELEGTQGRADEPPTFQFPAFKEQVERALGGTRRSGRATPGIDDSVRVLVLGVPAATLPIYVRFGGFNECPGPALQAVALAHWQEQLGARLVFVGSDTLEYWVDRPPLTLDAVRTLAWEQYLFCSDIVDQGTSNVAALGRELAGNHAWFFWWD
jgi:hypothetical protein